jgi:hypothetical protein
MSCFLFSRIPDNGKSKKKKKEKKETVILHVCDNKFKSRRAELGLKYIKFIIVNICPEIKE